MEITEVIFKDCILQSLNVENALETHPLAISLIGVMLTQTEH